MHATVNPGAVEPVPHLPVSIHQACECRPGTTGAASLQQASNLELRVVRVRCTIRTPNLLHPTQSGRNPQIIGVTPVIP